MIRSEAYEFSIEDRESQTAMLESTRAPHFGRPLIALVLGAIGLVVYLLYSHNSALIAAAQDRIKDRAVHLYVEDQNTVNEINRLVGAQMAAETWANSHRLNRDRAAQNYETFTKAERGTHLEGRYSSDYKKGLDTEEAAMQAELSKADAIDARIRSLKVQADAIRKKRAAVQSELERLSRLPWTARLFGFETSPDRYFE